jgi:hypothetical protein
MNKQIILSIIFLIILSFSVSAINAVPELQCSNGANLISNNPERTIAICDDSTDATCEQDFATICPVDWHLCSPTEYNSGNDNWQGTISSWLLGEITCRDGYGAGHYTLWDLETAYSTDVPFNQHAGSSLPQCQSDYGCNEQQYYALCCYGEGNGEVPPENNVPEFGEITIVGLTIVVATLILWRRRK